MSDILVTKLVDPDQTVAVLAGDDYVALEVDYRDSHADGSYLPDAVVLMAPTGAIRLAYALCKAFLKARKVFAFIPGATRGGS